MTSIAVGEDGPTHEPVEHLSSYRGMPNLTVLRPADGNEVSAAWEIAVSSADKPTMLVRRAKTYLFWKVQKKWPAKA